jgi:hypothetical protein
MKEMGDGVHPVLKLLLTIFLLILSGIMLWAINEAIGVYLTAIWWLGLVCVIGIFDIYAYVKVTKQRD